MKKVVRIVKPFIIGSFLITILAIIATTVSYFFRDNGVTYFFCGVLGAFGGGFFIYKFAQPISPLTVIMIIPVMFSGIFFSEYIQIKTAKILLNTEPSTIKSDNSTEIFELTNYKILTKMISKYSFTKREKDRIFHKTVCTTPIVNSDWVINNQINLFAVCEKDDCSSCFSANQKFARVLKSETSDNFKSYIQSMKNGVKKNNLNLVNKPIFIELIEDINQYATKKRDLGIIIFLSLLFLWNFISIFSFKTKKENIC